MEQFLQVGVISSTHGIRGEVKVYPTTDDNARFQELKEVLLDTGKEQIPLEIQNVRYFKQMVILKFKGIDNINDIERYKGRPLLVTREHAVPLNENEYYIADLIGMDILTENGDHLGHLSDVLETGANDVYIIQTKDEKEVLIPAIQECILKVDPEANQMTIHLMKGLIQ